MKIRSILVLMLMLAIVLSSFVGCTKNGETGGSVTGPEKQGKATESPDSAGTAEKKHMEISIALWDFEKFDDALAEIVKEKLNITIKTVPFTWDNYLEQTKLFAAANDMPDCIASYTTEDASRFYSWIDQGIIRDIPEEMINKYPNVKKIVENNEVVNFVKDIKGGYYFIPRPESQSGLYTSNVQYLYYRKDWLENVGIDKVPETIDEFYNMLKAFKEKDPDKNGKDDTYGYTYYGVPRLFSIWGIIPESWVEEDGKWIPGYISKKNIEPLKFLQKLYHEELLDSEFAKNGYVQTQQKFFTGSFGVMQRNADTQWIYRIVQEFSEVNPDIKDPLSVIGILPPLKLDDNSQPLWQQNFQNGGTEISSHVSDEKLDRILELDNYLLSPEFKELFRFGIEGETYRKEGDKYILLDDPETGKPFDLNVVYPSRRIYCFSDWDWDFGEEPSHPYITDDIRQLSREAREKYNNAVLQESMVKFLSTPAKDDLTINWRDSYIQMIISGEDIETAFDRFVEDAMNKGVAKAIEEVTELANELGL